MNIRFPLERVNRPFEKVFILIQAILGTIPLNAPEYKNPDCTFSLEAAKVYKHALRLIRCFVESAIARKAGTLLKLCLELHRCINAKGWEDRTSVLRQLEGIGEKGIQALASHGVTTIEKVASLKPYQIETWLNRKPPFGRDLIKSANRFPQCMVSLEELDSTPSNGTDPVLLSLQIGCSANLRETTYKGPKLTLGGASVLTLTSSGTLVDYRKISVKALLNEERFFTVVASLQNPSESVEVHVSPDEYAGVAISLEYKPKLSADQFPIPDTRPLIKPDPAPLTERTESVDDRSGTRRQVKATTELKPHGIEVQNSCGHRCKDKSSCRHRCCQDESAKVHQNRSHVEERNKASKRPDLSTTIERPLVRRASLVTGLDDLYKDARIGNRTDGFARMTIRPALRVLDLETSRDAPDTPDNIVCNSGPPKKENISRIDPNISPSTLPRVREGTAIGRRTRDVPSDAGTRHAKRMKVDDGDSKMSWIKVSKSIINLDRSDSKPIHSSANPRTSLPETTLSSANFQADEEREPLFLSSSVQGEEEACTSDFELDPRFFEDYGDIMGDLPQETVTKSTAQLSSPVKMQHSDVKVVEDFGDDRGDGLIGSLDDDAAFDKFFSGVEIV